MLKRRCGTASQRVFFADDDADANANADVDADALFANLDDKIVR